MEREAVGFARWCWVACEARFPCPSRRVKTWRAGSLAVASCLAVAKASDGYAVRPHTEPWIRAEGMCVH